MTRPTCPRCTRPEVSCYCHLIREIRNRWPVRILQEAREAAHPLNTGRIAALALADCRVLKCDLHHNYQIKAAELIKEQEAVLIYPGPGSRPLRELRNSLPRALFFIDATWRKSYRMLQESPDLHALPCYHLDPPPLPRYRIRKAFRADSVSTLEAIVACLTLLEEAPAPDYEALLEVMDWMTKQQISHIGEALFRRNYPG